MVVGNQGPEFGTKISIICCNDIMTYAKYHHLDTAVLGSESEIHNMKGGTDNGRRKDESRGIPGDDQR